MGPQQVRKESEGLEDCNTLEEERYHTQVAVAEEVGAVFQKA